MNLRFNWNHRTTTDHGPTRYVQCAHCRHRGFCRLVEFSTWLTVAPLPLWQRGTRYSLLCEVCAGGERLVGNEVGVARKQNAIMRCVLNQARANEGTPAGPPLAPQYA